MITRKAQSMVTGFEGRLEGAVDNLLVATPSVFNQSQEDKYPQGHSCWLNSQGAQDN